METGGKPRMVLVKEGPYAVLVKSEGGLPNADYEF